MQAALTAVIALLSLSLVSSFLDKEIFEYCISEKELKGVTKLYIALVLLLLSWALIVLPGAAQAPSFSNAGGWAEAAYVGCAFTAVGTFLIQALIRYTILQKSRNQKTRAEEDDNKPLDDSTKRSVATPEGSQQQAKVTPKEESKKPQDEPSTTGSQNRGESGTTGGAEERISPKGVTEDSDKEQ
ncbi:hypothetical protein GWO60_04500 [Corynebacterium macginleyi]|uniref:MARVEL domain-containing protein n=1 Tax=Corynebacterium macginleyi TaxID=38290 RepID=A0ABS1Y3J0_9CORY|nr:hypothetical protein [Corynebacterium macginleyi]MBK4173833.1 hypothetical protein [Corynebacterium macginleyi]MBM0242954.1 hypothetical protein [Corynebacterium macginleyi]